jgi:hypothetical protein
MSKTCPKCGSEPAHNGVTPITNTPYIKWRCNSVEYQCEDGYFDESHNCLRNQLEQAQSEVASLKRAVEYAEGVISDQQNQLEQVTKELDVAREALTEVAVCPCWVDTDTVPEAGEDSAPEQVVYNIAINLLRLRKVRNALAESQQEEATQ